MPEPFKILARGFVFLYKTGDMVDTLFGDMVDTF